MVKFTNWLIPVGASNRPGQLRYPSYVTIHECSLGREITPANFNREHYIRLMEKPKVKEIGYHYLVTDSEVVRFIPDNEKAYQAGTALGNLQSIGIERLVNDGTDVEKAISVQAQLSATLMYKWDIPLFNVVPHKHWRGKDCPARLLAGQNGGWARFIAEVQLYFETRDFIPEILEDDSLK